MKRHFGVKLAEKDALIVKHVASEKHLKLLDAKNCLVEAAC